MSFICSLINIQLAHKFSKHLISLINLINLIILGHLSYKHLRNLRQTCNSSKSNKILDAKHLTLRIYLVLNTIHETVSLNFWIYLDLFKHLIINLIHLSIKSTSQV